MNVVHDTTSVRPRDRLAFWRDVVCRQFVNLDVEVAAPPGQFDARIRSAQLPTLQVSRVAAPAQCVRRTERRLLDDAGEHSIVMLQLSGRARIAQDGCDGVLTAGSLGVLDSGRPYSIAFPDRFDQVVLKLPTAGLRRRFGRQIPLTTSGATAQGLLTSRLLAAVSDAALGPAAGALPDERIEALIEELLAMAFQPAMPGAGRAGSIGEQRVARARAFVAEQLGNPLLTVAAVAAAQGVTPRLLQMHFAERGLQLSRLILDSRLDACLAALRAPASRRAGITDIALAHGFADASHFARAFKARFGQTASQVRQAGS